MSMSNSRDVGTNQKTVTTAGTREPLAAGEGLKVLSITIKALRGNGGKIYIGDNLVSSSVGFELDAADSIDLATDDPTKPIDLTQIWIDASVSGEGVSYIYLRE